MKLNLDKIQQELTEEQLLSIMAALGASDYENKENYIIFRTICHNVNPDEASMKLYYYKSNHLFHCYTECGDTFNIFELIMRVAAIQNYNNGDFSFRNAIEFLIKHSGINNTESYVAHGGRYTSIADKYRRKSRSIELPTYPEGLLNLFEPAYPPEWMAEGIGIDSMDKFEIRYSISRNKIIIPHYDINGNLVGIRGRALNPMEVELYGKYMPVEIENKFYAHPLSQNLYGLNLSKEYIKEQRIAILFESEKSVLMYDTYFNKNVSVAVCGSNFNKAQLDLLCKNTQPREIVIAFDKEYTAAASPEADKYFKKLWDLSQKYSQYCHISFIFDRENLLAPKDSPIDKGKEIFLTLFKKRIKPWERIK